MPVRIFAAVVAVALMLGYLLPVVFKLKEVSLGAVIAIGLVMMLRDLWQSLRAAEH
ncbi:MAG: hypothetical protein JNJ89_07250 [Rubrivivax sp.]|nr:hypothetical protein [Rubrivivax sp.]